MSQEEIEELERQKVVETAKGWNPD